MNRLKVYNKFRGNEAKIQKPSLMFESVRAGESSSVDLCKRQITDSSVKARKLLLKSDQSDMITSQQKQTLKDSISGVEISAVDISVDANDLVKAIDDDMSAELVSVSATPSKSIIPNFDGEIFNAVSTKQIEAFAPTIPI